MGCCLFALLTGFFPRLGFFLVWVFTDEVDRAFDSFWVPLLGLIFLPLTALMYALTWAPVEGPEGFDWFLIIGAFLIDVSSYGGGEYARRGRSD
jgi:hypothetical protein